MGMMFGAKINAYMLSSLDYSHHMTSSFSTLHCFSNSPTIHREGFLPELRIAPVLVAPVTLLGVLGGTHPFWFSTTIYMYVDGLKRGKEIRNIAGKFKSSNEEMCTFAMCCDHASS
jgi:hypothetical protein